MPLVRKVITGSPESISRPVILDIVGQLKAITGIESVNNIYFPGVTRTAINVGSNVNSKTNRYPKFPTEKFIFIEVEEDYSLDSVNSTSTNGQGSWPFFMDEKLGVYMSAIYTTIDTEINFKFSTPSRDEANMWRENIRIRTSQLRDMNEHTIDYHYNIPLEFMMLIKDIHEKREAIEPYGQTFPEYFLSHSTDKITLMSDISDINRGLTVAERQNEIIGMFDFEGFPQPIERDETNGTYIANFRYKFSYKRVAAIAVKYPISVHNQFLSDAYITFVNTDKKQVKDDKAYQGSAVPMAAFRAQTTLKSAMGQYEPIRIPYMDDFIPSINHRSMANIFTALCFLDNDRRFLLNLRDLGDVNIDEDILDFISDSEYSYINRPFASILNIEIFINNSIMAPDKYICDSNLNIIANEPLSKRDQVRVRFNICLDIDLLRPISLERLRQNPKALVKIVSSINEALGNFPHFRDLYHNGKISEMDFNNIYRVLTGKITHSNPAGSYYGPGQNLNPNSFPLSGVSSGFTRALEQIDPRVIKNYFNNTMVTRSVQVSSILAYSQSSNP